ncbi:peptidase C26 [Coriobacterium glomerans PW2]|uniref:Peptidase C26 n=1 Tax=Coriobacterium glomerans (strain ATCC 49209 / DSM 20642 / JCM 10262 / PW2) TaxID=700015 RepID=F2NA25_CORGP|nr:gamma-glutamyl-gamma-aminobutyrate hydrolase family protein [Coriobacterium glomerans]AEB06419.1 peptidase C26 [Coriobacterium glomerans PW2]
MNRKPKIGIAANILIVEAPPLPGMQRVYVNRDYIASLEIAGCIPVMLPVITDVRDVAVQIEGLDGIVLSGGWDIDPLLYGEQPLERQGFSISEVDRFSVAAVRAAVAAKIPVLGICKGMQVINIAFGGTLYQDIATQRDESIRHVQQGPCYDPTHHVNLERGSFLADVLGERTVVNSIHHQSVKDLAAGFAVSARADDGVIEGIEHEDGCFICGVQWHPEMMTEHGDTAMLRLFQAFAEKCERREELS